MCLHSVVGAFAVLVVVVLYSFWDSDDDSRYTHQYTRAGTDLVPDLDIRFVVPANSEEGPGDFYRWTDIDWRIGTAFCWSHLLMISVILSIILAFLVAYQLKKRRVLILLLFIGLALVLFNLLSHIISLWLRKGDAADTESADEVSERGKERTCTFFMPVGKCAHDLWICAWLKNITK